MTALSMYIEQHLWILNDSLLKCHMIQATHLLLMFSIMVAMRKLFYRQTPQITKQTNKFSQKYSLRDHCTVSRTNKYKFQFEAVINHLSYIKSQRTIFNPCKARPT